jgi:FkbM family methyltransferase
MLLNLLRAITRRNAADLRPNCVVNGIPMRLDAGEFIQRSMAEGVYEPIQTGWVRQHLHPGAVFVDVGASFGYFTSLAWSLVGAGGRVFAFEPSPHAFAALKRNMGGPRFSNITLVNSAVGRKTGELTIYMPPENGLHSPSAFISHENSPAIRVPLTTLDEYAPLAGVKCIDLLKMDVEGSEPDVLAGMSGLIAQGRVRRIMCEFNTWWLNANKTTAAALQKQFQQMGFEIEDKTPMQTKLPAIRDETFDLQDILYKYVN